MGEYDGQVRHSTLMEYSAASTENIARMLFGGSNIKDGCIVSPYHSGQDISLNAGVYPVPTLLEVKGATRRYDENGDAKPQYFRFEPMQIARLLATGQGSDTLFGRYAVDVRESLVDHDLVQRPSYIMAIVQDVPYKSGGKKSTRIGKTSDMTLHAHAIKPSAVYAIDAPIMAAFFSAQMALRGAYKHKLAKESGADLSEDDPMTLLVEAGISLPSWEPSQAAQNGSYVSLLQEYLGDAADRIIVAGERADLVTDFNGTRMRPGSLNVLLDRLKNGPQSTNMVDYDPNRAATCAADAAAAYLNYHEMPIYLQTTIGAFGIPVYTASLATNPSLSSLEAKVHAGGRLLETAHKRRVSMLSDRKGTPKSTRDRAAIWDPFVVLPNRTLSRNLAWQTEGDGEHYEPVKATDVSTIPF